jgi:ribonuclease T2
MAVAFARFASAVLVGALFGVVEPSVAEEHPQNEPGKFDFYMFALSWSPSFCADSAERASAAAEDPNRRPDPQCGSRPHSFVVHGLWPQYERGFPEFCQVPAPRLNRSIVSSMLDVMPSPSLIYHEWDRHGTCAGIPPAAYFTNIRKARAVVKIPPQFLDVSAPLTVTPQEVADAFVKANPGLAANDIAIACGTPRLDEVRICMTRDFRFRDCPETERLSCRRDRLELPTSGFGDH